MITNIRLKLLLAVTGALIFLDSCTKKSDNIVLPEQSISNLEPIVSDTFSILSASIAEDSVPTDILLYKLVGAMSDPNFGLSKSNVFAELYLKTLSDSLNQPGNVFDSAILTLQYTSKTAYYGNLLTSQNFSVHELTGPFPSANSNIYSSTAIAYAAASMGEYNGVINLKDSVSVREGASNIRIAPSLKIKLTDAAGLKFFNAPTGILNSDNTFKAFFKGIAIVSNSNPNSGDGGIVAINPNSVNSKITIYHSGNKQFEIFMKTDRSFANYRIVGQPADITNQKNNPNIDYITNYLQSLSGAKLKITIPYLADFAAAKNIIIHKAEIIINPLAGSYNAVYPLPQRLLVLQPNASGASIAIPDLFGPYFDGRLRSDNNYVLNITEFMQFQLNSYKTAGNLKNVLHVVIPTSDPIAPSRLVIDAQKTIPNPKLSIRIVYTKL